MDGTPEEIVSFIEGRHSPSHQLSLLASGLYGKDSFLFIDLETMGFFSRPVILLDLQQLRTVVSLYASYLSATWKKTSGPGADLPSPEGKASRRVLQRKIV